MGASIEEKSECTLFVRPDWRMHAAVRAISRKRKAVCRFLVGMRGQIFTESPPPGMSDG